MKIIPLLLLATPAWATAYTAVGTNPFQLWGTTSVWSPAGVPGAGDTVNIPDGITVTLSQNITIGASSARYLGPRRGPYTSNSIAISLNNSGRLIIFQGTTLIVRGDIVYTAANCANTTNALLMLAGSTLEFDASAAPLPSATHYAFGPDGNNGCRGVWSAGTATQRNTIFSNPAGGAAQFSLRGNTGANGPFVFAYTDFTNIGDASNPGWQIGYEYSGNNYIQWNASYSTFTNCGKISYPNPIFGISTNAIFRHSYNVHNQTAANEIFDGWINIEPIGAGVREIRNNVFDKPMSLSFFQTNGFTIWSNYFGEATQFGGGPGPWAAFQGNFYRESLNSILGYTISLNGDALNNYWLYEEPQTANPHGPNAHAFPSSMIGNITDHTGNLTGSMSAWWITNNSLAGSNYSFINNLILPNAEGHSTFWITLTIPITPGTTLTVEHNTAMIDNVSGTGGLGINTNHGLTAAANGMLASYRSNLLWNPGTSNLAYKLWAADQGSAHNLDVCAPVACDYNDGWNMLTDGGGFRNGGNGYADNFSSVPGQHDLSANPVFVDSTRNMATFDSAYLHNTANAWSSGASYSVGNMVSSSDSTLYNGATINYRYTNGSFDSTSCSSANPKPGLYTAVARACWEWATLYDIRQAIAATTTNAGTCPGNGIWTTAGGQNQCLWDDQTIGAHGVDIIQTLIQWVTAGYSPTNAQLAGAAHDGTDIGAVAVSFTAPSP
jgi:hypothetical protein